MVAKYKRGNRFEDDIPLADVVVDWQGLTLKQQSEVAINDDGLPELEGCPGLLECAEGLLEAVHAGAVTGSTYNGYADVPLHPSLMRLNRASAANWIAEVEKRWALASPPKEVQLSPAELAEDLAEKLLGLEEVKAILGISRSGVYRLVSAGKLDPPVLLRGKAHWTAATVAARLASTRVAAEPAVP